MLDSLRARWDSVEPSQKKLIIVLGVATVLTAGGSFALLHVRGAMTTLYTGLQPAESREIATELSAQGIEYQISEDESAISVPVRSQAAARMRLAAAGLPRSAPAKGWELFGEGGLAVTKPQQRAMQIRALQGELARSIASLEPVTKAAVHISLKEESPFVEDEEPAKAAVLLHLKDGQSLDREQAIAVAHLVAKSVPDLETAQVTILDQEGRMLFSDNVARASGGTDGDRNVEREIERRVQSQLDATFGLGKTIVRATCELRTDRTETRRTTYDPLPGQQQGVPGRETTEQEDYQGTGGVGAAGVPGVGANLFNENARLGGAAGGGRYNRTKSDRDYLVNKSEEVVVQPGGDVQRLTLGIFVDEALATETSKIETVARSAAGIDPKRGDLISVESVKFAGSSTDGVADGGKLDLVRAIARLILNSLALIIGLLTLRSIIAALKPQPGTLTPTYTEGLGHAGEMRLIPAGDPRPSGGGGGGMTPAGAPATGLTMAHSGGGGLEPSGPGLSTPGFSGAPVESQPLLSSVEDLDDDVELVHAAGPTPEELMHRVHDNDVSDIAEVVRHWLRGDLDE